MHESSGGLSSSLRSIAHSSTAKAAPTASPIFQAFFSRACYGARPQWLEKLQPRGVAKPQPRWRKRYLPPTDPRAARSLFTDPRGRLGWTRALAEALSWVGSCPTPKAQLWVNSNPSPKAQSWVGSCPALNMLPWVGSLSPLPRFKIFAHTSHV